MVDTPSLAFGSIKVIPTKGSWSREATAVDKEPTVLPSGRNIGSTNEVRNESLDFLAIFGVHVDFIFDLEK